MRYENQKMGSLPTIRRLPAYLTVLRQIDLGIHDTVSSTFIADKLKIEPIQVRKDLAITGIEGRPKVGYVINDLIGAIERYLGWDSNKQAILVGVGHLGSALLGYPGFQKYGLQITAAFDASSEVVGTIVHGHQVYPMDDLPDLVRSLGIIMSILTVPAEHAQHVADVMISSGVSAIWNFSPVTLEVPAGVVVQNEDLSSGLAVLSVRSSRTRRD